MILSTNSGEKMLKKETRIFACGPTVNLRKNYKFIIFASGPIFPVYATTLITE